MKAEYKIPNGKLIACNVEQELGVITKLKISGDFFMHPEDSIIELEKTILGATVKDYPAKINQYFDENKIKLVGVKITDFIEVIRLALAAE